MARTFDGVDDQVAFGSEAAVDDLAAFTAYALVRVTANVTDERQILAKMNGTYNGKMYLAANGGGGSNNKIICVLTGSIAATAESVANVLVPNTWQVVIATGTVPGGVTPAPKLYVATFGSALAEVSYASQATGSTQDSDAGATVRAGARDPADATFYAGGMAGVALWNRVLSDGELAALGLGFSPLFFPSGRVLCGDFDGVAPVGTNFDGTAGTVTGTTALDHPSVIYPYSVSYAKSGSGGSPPPTPPDLRRHGISRSTMRGLGRSF